MWEVMSIDELNPGNLIYYRERNPNNNCWAIIKRIDYHSKTFLVEGNRLKWSFNRPHDTYRFYRANTIALALHKRGLLIRGRRSP